MPWYVGIKTENAYHITGLKINFIRRIRHLWMDALRANGKIGSPTLKMRLEQPVLSPITFITLHGQFVFSYK
jgi:hypothetical protein